MNSFLTVVYESIDDLNQEPIGEPLGVSEGGGRGMENMELHLLFLKVNHKRIGQFVNAWERL